MNPVKTHAIDQVMGKNTVPACLKQGIEHKICLLMNKAKAWAGLAKLTIIGQFFRHIVYVDK